LFLSLFNELNYSIFLSIGFQHLSQTSTLIEDVTPDLRMRDRELTEIAKSIADLAELFKDLSVLVIDQGTLLDSVEYNIEQTSVQVAEAVKELDMATRYVVSAALLRGSPVMMRFC
jgi:t-SNARE complex subunit (syntaxin)